MEDPNSPPPPNHLGSPRQKQGKRFLFMPKLGLFQPAGMGIAGGEEHSLIQLCPDFPMHLSFPDLLVATGRWMEQAKAASHWLPSTLSPAP